MYSIIFYNGRGRKLLFAFLVFLGFTLKGLPTAAFEAWGYGMTLIKTIGPNYNEAESIRESNAFKAAIPMPAASEIITAAIWEYGFAEFMKTV